MSLADDISDDKIGAFLVFGFAALVVLGMIGTFVSDNETQRLGEACEAAGGTPYKAKQERLICLRAGTIIPLNEVQP